MITRSMAKNLLSVSLCSKRASNSVCPICLLTMDLNNQETQCVQFQCGHQSHVDCIQSWISNQTKCPTCRHPIDTNSLINTSNGKLIAIEPLSREEKMREKRLAYDAWPQLYNFDLENPNTALRSFTMRPSFATVHIAGVRYLYISIILTLFFLLVLKVLNRF